MGKTRQTLACMDSGVGGLAVLKRFTQHLPNSPYVFVGDTALMPYGEKPLTTVRDRVLDVHQWIHRTYPLAAFVLACNTATVAAYDMLEAQGLPYPILEPVKTTAEWVNTHVSPGKRLGILATPGTVGSQRYLKFLDAAWPVEQVACSGLASIIETGVCHGPELDEVLLPYLRPLQESRTEVVLLGCTHYSLIRDQIQAHLGPDVEIIDSAEVLAQVAIPIIEQLDLGSGPQQMLVTGDPERFKAAINLLPLEILQSKPVTQVTLGQEVKLS